MMIKHYIIGAASAALALASIAAPAMAATNASAPLYGPVANFVSCATGGTPTANTFGSVQLWLNPSNVVNSFVVIQNGVPNTEYSIWINQDPGDCPTTPTGTITTNVWGWGWGQVSEPKAANATMFWLSAVGGNQVLRSPARALAWPTPMPMPSASPSATPGGV